jgi:single-strand DNA-binding protein
MSSLNKVFLMGNLTRDPDVRYTPSGTAVCAIGLAVNRRFTTQGGEDREEVCFVDIEVFGRQAETCGEYLRKGAPILLEGRLRLDQWDDRQTGQRRSRLKVVGERVQFLGAPAHTVSRESAGAAGGGDDDYGDSGGRSTERPPRRRDDGRGNPGGEPSRNEDRPARRAEPDTRSQAPEMPPFEPIEDDVDDDIPF